MAMRSIICALLALCAVGLGGCRKPAPEYGVEQKLILVGSRRAVWAVAPAINLSGQRMVDPILQADLLYEQLQQVQGLTAIPVNRVVEVYRHLGIDQVQTEEEAALVCEALGCDGLLVPTVTIYDPFNPPKFGVTLTLMRQRPGRAVPSVDTRTLVREARAEMPLPPPSESVVQAVGMYDASNGSVREALWAYAAGRSDPTGPLGAREYLVSMDRYCGFVYHEMIATLLSSPQFQRP